MAPWTRCHQYPLSLFARVLGRRPKPFPGIPTIRVTVDAGSRPVTICDLVGGATFAFDGISCLTSRENDRFVAPVWPKPPR